MQQWKAAAVAVAEQKRTELQALTEADAAWIVLHVLPEPDYAAFATPEHAYSGLVEQQRYFAKLRK